VKRDHVNYVLVGVVVVVGLVLLLGGLLLITGRRGGSTEYHTYYRNVTGLRYGAPVFYQGYRIGEVDGLLPERTDTGTRYRVTLSVREDWPIPQDSVARLMSSGLLADVSIGIREGDAKVPVAAGGEIKGEESADIFGAMNELAAEVTSLTRSQITPLIQTLSQRVDSITGSIDKGTPELFEKANALMDRLRVASDSVNELLSPANRDSVGAILTDLRKVSADLHVTKENLDQAMSELAAITHENRPGIRKAVADLQEILATMSSRVDAIVHHLDASSRNLDEFSREIRKNPNRLLLSPKGDPKEEANQ
jgi:phospholipid/cholesterol/gamma-HCH transport system substrate-binding protein